MPGSGAVQPKLLVMEEAWGPGDTRKALGARQRGAQGPVSEGGGEVWAGQWARLPPGEAGPALQGAEGLGGS